jgi:hypothetical protein
LSISRGSLPLLNHEIYGGGNSPYVINRYKTHVVRVLMLAGDTLKQATSAASFSRRSMTGTPTGNETAGLAF